MILYFVIFKSYKDKRLKYYYAPKHTLLSEARNEAINKSTGEWLTCEAPLADDEYKATAIKNAEDNMKSITDKKPFKRCYSDIEETFRTKKTGNKVLGFVCSFCPYKLPCWGSKLQLLPQQQSQGKNPKWVWYTEVNNPKQDKALANDGG